MDDDGNYFIASEDDIDGDGRSQLRVRRFNSNNEEIFNDIIELDLGKWIFKPNIEVIGDEKFVITGLYYNDNTSRSVKGVFAKVFDYGDGIKKIDPEIEIRSVSNYQIHTIYNQSPGIGSDSRGNFIITWSERRNNNKFGCI